jgi:hypothetical protein
MRKIRNACNILIKTYEGKRKLGCARPRWEHIRINLKGIGDGGGGFIWLRKASCRQPSGSVKSLELFD